MSPRGLALVQCGLLCAVLCAIGAPAGAQETLADGTAQAIHPSSLRLARLHTAHFVRTPDGLFWDMWGQQEYLDVYNRVVKKQPIRHKRTAEGWTSWVTTGHRWVVEEGSRDAVAWGIGKGIGGVMAPGYLERDAGGLPPLWHCPRRAEFSFLYVNEDNRDVRTRDEGKASTMVAAQLGDNLYKVVIEQARALGPLLGRARSLPRDGVFVVIDDPGQVRGGFLRGEYILWPDPAVELPAGTDGPRFRYLQVKDLRPSPEDLVDAVEREDAEIVTWQYGREGGAYRWTRTVLPLRYREDRPPSGDDGGSAPARERPSAPEIPLTHLLVLTNGDWVEGQLIAEDGDGVRFLVVVAGISTERTYTRDEVARVVER